MHRTTTIRILILALTLVGLVGPGLAGSVRAQGAPTLASLEISLWPEYDRPELLVIYRGELDAAVTLPAAVEIALPARVGLPSAVAYLDETGQRLTQQYETRVEGDQLIVAFSLVTPRFQLEYYDALPADASGKRTYAFAYTAGYAITAMTLEFQQPPAAMGLVLNPPADTTAVAGDGLTYHLRQVGALASGDTRDWTFSYVKTDSSLTEEGLAQATSMPAATGGSSNSTVWIALGVLAALIAGGGAGFWLAGRGQPRRRTQLSRRTEPVGQPPKRRGSGRGEPALQPRPQPQVRTQPVAGGEARFCHQCGAELRPDSAFCHECGTQVRGR